MLPRAFITGSAGPVLTAEERDFLRDADPWGFIVFKRNIESPDQLLALVESFREAVGRSDAPVLVDQEGGRVQRLGPPHWPCYPAAADYGRLFARDHQAGVAAARLGARLMAHDLAMLGITVDCLPVADVPAVGADPVIGDRAYAQTPESVSVLGAAVAAGLAEGGVLPVVKHTPGHGRATVDSHEKLPIVSADRVTLEGSDFQPFRALRNLPIAMTAHVVFTAIDPGGPATTSARVVREVIREWIGFDGVLMSDDISMGALAGRIRDRVRAAIGAGCDMVLHCNGRLDEMRDVAAEAPALAGRSAQRAAAALASRGDASSIDVAAARAQLAALTVASYPLTAGTTPS